MFSRKLACLILALAGLAACNPFPTAYTYRYRVTVEVDTPQGLRTGSSVWETTAWEGSGIPDRSIRTRERGEAVAVRLPTGTLFALLRGQDMSYDYPAGIVEGHLLKHPQPDVPLDRRKWKENNDIIVRTKPAFELYPDEYPLLVSFRDIARPESVEKVDPTYLATTFGRGVRLRRVFITVTDEQVTERIGKIVPWMNQQKGSLQKMPPLTPKRDSPFAAHITDGDFSRGVR